jgi:hypothetical protein
MNVIPTQPLASARTLASVPLPISTSARPSSSLAALPRIAGEWGFQAAARARISRNSGGGVAGGRVGGIRVGVGLSGAAGGLRPTSGEGGLAR